MKSWPHCSKENQDDLSIINNFISSALRDWIPFRLRQEAGALNCQWLYLGSNTFDDPFFDETISRCRALPENSKLRQTISSVSMLQEWAPQVEAIPPTAIIFHVSRCGSTLLSQMLAVDPANIVLSEVPFFDELLRWGFRENAMQQAGPFLKDAISLYGTRRNEQQQNLFIKADSWHIHFYKELRQLYPHTPFLLLYRRPDEVVRSHQKKRGMRAVPGLIEPGIFGFDKDSISHADLDGHMAKVLETYYCAFMEVLQKDKLAFAFDYKEGMVNIIQDMLANCGISVSEEQLAAIKKRGSRHGKFPEQAFSEEALTGTAPACLQKAMQLYDVLGKLRLTHRPTYGKD